MCLKSEGVPTCDSRSRLYILMFWHQNEDLSSPLVLFYFLCSFSSSPMLESYVVFLFHPTLFTIFYLASVLFCLCSSVFVVAREIRAVPLPHESPFLFLLLLVGLGLDTIEKVDCEMGYHGVGSDWNSCVSSLSCPFSLSADLTPWSNGWIWRVRNVLKFEVLLQCISVKGTECILSNKKITESAKIRQKFFLTELFTIKTKSPCSNYFWFNCINPWMFVKFVFITSSYFPNIWTKTPDMHKASDWLMWTGFSPGVVL